MTARTTTACIGGVMYEGEACEYCTCSYTRCTSLVLGIGKPRRGRACCDQCASTDTHNATRIGPTDDRLPTADATLERLKADLDSTSQPPDYPKGTVLRFSVRYEVLGKTYTYAALYIGGSHWYLTARFDSGEHFQTTMGTRALMRSLIDTGAFDIEVASAWTAVER